MFGQISLTFCLIIGCFGFSSESLRLIRHLITSVNKGNSLFLRSLSNVELILRRRLPCTPLGTVFDLKGYHMTALMHTLCKTLLKGSVIYLPQKIIKLEPHAQDRGSKSPRTITAHDHQRDLKAPTWVSFTPRDI